ncbi:MAG TPA: hypothetical protein VGE07_10840 [Herpetosiphonaceae bacterium]
MFSLFSIGTLFFCLAVLGLAGVVIFILKVGVVIQKVGEKPHIDGGTYTLDQGQEVTNKPEQR